MKIWCSQTLDGFCTNFTVHLNATRICFAITSLQKLVFFDLLSLKHFSLISEYIWLCRCRYSLVLELYILNKWKSELERGVKWWSLHTIHLLTIVMVFANAFTHHNETLRSQKVQNKTPKHITRKLGSKICIDSSFVT